MITRSSSLGNKDSGLYEASSHLFDVRDAITRNGPFRSCQLLEEMKWPPRGVGGSQESDKHESLSISRDDKCSTQSSPWRTYAGSINDQYYQRSSCSPLFHGHAKFDAEVIKLLHISLVIHILTCNR